MDLKKLIEQQREWSLETFGPGAMDKQIIEHIRRELIEIQEAPGDLVEWIDVILLALDGASRNGHTPDDICQALTGKLWINLSREWDKETGEHVR